MTENIPIEVAEAIVFREANKNWLLTDAMLYWIANNESVNAVANRYKIAEATLRRAIGRLEEFGPEYREYRKAKLSEQGWD